MELVTLTEAQNYLDTEEDVTPAVTRAEARVLAILQNPVLETEYEDTLHGGGVSLILSHFPVKSATVTDVTSGNVVEPDYINQPAGMLESYTQWGPGKRRWNVSYTAGLATDVASVPADIKHAVLLLARQEVGDEYLQSESIGDYSFQRFKDSSGLVRATELLAPYIRR